MKDFFDKNINVLALTALAVFFGALSLKNPTLGKDAVTAAIGALSAIMVQHPGRPN